MLWKVHRNCKSKMSTTNIPTTSTNPAVEKNSHKINPAVGNNPKSCLRRTSDSMHSGWSSLASSGSSHRSETYKCDHSSSRGSNSSEPIRLPSQQACDGFDARVSVGADRVVVESSCSARDDHSYRPQVVAAHESDCSASSSQKSKGVRFSVVEIRDYEREVGDNPSCSNGPPIGIGWSHLDSRVVHLSHYETSRPYRKGQLEMVLTREEREAILEEWGVTPREMINSIRALNKAKDQRRQTVRNLDKAQRVEEGIESAARKLKRMLNRKRSTRSEVQELQRQAEIAAAQSRVGLLDSSDYPNEDGLDNEQSPYRSSSVQPNPEITGGIVEDFEVKYPSPSPLGAKVSGGNSKATTLSTSAGTSDELDTISFISGISIGNSTTPSAKEIERFYRDLEMEMFGDQKLPSMVGQTLEMDVDIPAEEKVFYDPAPHCCSSEPPSVVCDTYDAGSTLPSQHEHCKAMSSMAYPHSQQSYAVQSMHGLLQAVSHHAPYDLAYGYQTPAQFPFAAHLGSQREENWRDLHSYEPNVVSQSRLADCIPYASASTMRRNWRCTADGPRVTHSPIAFLSPNLMEGERTTRRGNPLSAWDPVTISEDDLGDAEIEQHFADHSPRNVISTIP